MTPRHLLFAGLCCAVVASLVAAPLARVAAKPEQNYRLELSVRKAVPNEGAETSAVVADVAFDKDGGGLFYAAKDAKTLGVIDSAKDPGKGDRPAKSLYRFALKARTWDEKEF